MSFLVADHPYSVPMPSNICCRWRKMSEWHFSHKLIMRSWYYLLPGGYPGKVDRIGHRTIRLIHWLVYTLRAFWLAIHTASEVPHWLLAIYIWGSDLLLLGGLCRGHECMRLVNRNTKRVQTGRRTNFVQYWESQFCELCDSFHVLLLNTWRLRYHDLWIMNESLRIRKRSRMLWI